MPVRSLLLVSALVAVLGLVPRPAFAQSTTDALQVEIVPITPHSSGVRTVAFSTDGRHLLSTGEDATIKLWDIATGQRLHAWDAHGQAYAVAFAHDGKTVLTNGRDKRVCFWDVTRSIRS